jgi:hypothetical protein
MGGCASSEASSGPEFQRSKEIDKMLKEVSVFLAITHLPLPCSLFIIVLESYD